MRRRIASPTAEAIERQMDEVQDQIDIMEEQLSKANPGTETVRQLEDDIEAAKADLDALGEVAKSARLEKRANVGIDRALLMKVLFHIDNMLFGTEEEMLDSMQLLRTILRTRRPIKYGPGESASPDSRELFVRHLLNLVVRAARGGTAADEMAAVAKSASEDIESDNKLRMARILDKMATIIEKVDLAEDFVNKPLAEVEAAVDAIYGDQSKNETYYFQRRGL